MAIVVGCATSVTPGARRADRALHPLVADEVARFVDLIDGRAKVVPLLEHRLAADCVERVTALPGLDCVHVGLTDLALSMGVANRFELLASPVLMRIAAAVRRRGLRLCVGGIGRACDASLPVPSELVYAQYASLGATGALVSRASFGREPATLELAAEVDRCREGMAEWHRQSASTLDEARPRFVAWCAANPLW